MDRRQRKQSRRRRNKHTPLHSSDEEFVPFTEGDFDDDEEEVEREYERYSSFEDLTDNKGRKTDGKNNKKKKSRRKRSKKEKNQESPLIWQVLEEEYNRWIDNNISSSSFSRVEDGVEGDGEGDDQTDTMEMVDMMEPSEDVILPLLRFQKEWLSWALQQEESRYKGGILADEMGMGKTIQAISLVLTARSIRAHLPVDVLGASRSSFVKSTLVICPVVAVIQWAGEIDKYTKEGSVRVLVYHGPKRSSDGLPDFSKYDFVLTTYKVIECEYRKSMAPEKLQCKWCGNMFTSKNLNFHLKYYCGPYAKTTEKQSKQVRKKAKLVDDQKDDNCEGKRMDKKDKRDVRAKKKDKFKERGAETGISRPSSVLHSVKWERIILDEAHSIKSRGSSTARAVFSLDSTYKWALSGTPLQNRVGELYSLVRFLQVHPYSYFFCKDCDCKALDYKIFGCKDCGHTSLRHFIWWNRYIAKPIQNAPDSEKATRALFYLRGMLLKSLVLRRTKKGRSADLALPPRIISLRRDILDTKEQDFYEALYNQSQTQFDSYVAAGTLLNNYAHIFELLIRLRQAVDHPYLVIYAANGEAVTSSDYNASVETTCCICHDLVEDSVVSSCKHIFCRGCLDQYFATTSGLLSCPSCSMPLTVDMTTKSPNENRAITSTLCFKRSSILSKINIDEFKASTKIDALKEEIRNMVEVDGSAKGIVFSQFTSFLDLINYSLQKSGIKCVQLVGSMSMLEREKAINRFTDDPEVKIFLMSLRAGGVALNLTVASHVFLMDPWWNPAVESQAQDRIHRIGQYKPIRVVRFVIKDTIEERILKLQDKKERVVEGTIGESAESMAKLTEKDLRFLFNT